MNCKKCGVFNVEGARFCRGCGSQIDADDLAYDVKAKTEELYCPKCGSANNSNYKFCKKCGCSVESDFNSMKAQNANVLIEQNTTIRRILCVMLLLAAILSLLTSVYYGLGFRRVLCTSTLYGEDRTVRLYTTNTWGVAKHLQNLDSRDMGYYFGYEDEEEQKKNAALVDLGVTTQIFGIVCYGALAAMLIIAMVLLCKKSQNSSKWVIAIATAGILLIVVDILVGYYGLDLCKEYESYRVEFYETHRRVMPQKTSLLLLPVLVLMLFAGMRPQENYAKSGLFLSNSMHAAIAEPKKQNEVLKRTLSAALITAIILCFISAVLNYSMSLPLTQIYEGQRSEGSFIDEYIMLPAQRNRTSIQVSWEYPDTPRFSEKISEADMVSLRVSVAYVILSVMLLISLLALHSNLRRGKIIVCTVGLVGIAAMVTEFVTEYWVMKDHSPWSASFDDYIRYSPHISFYVLFPLMIFIPFLAWNLRTKNK